ncbi:hypothetical protein HY29_13475 [Hyphomonas beringensis]|uniref:Uncharacterized protein n=1 Tax=Hyphomonas beringensis TaxID=1280946 RepID=A0A062U309_9PROT|nr:hypothetical protein [Hyphomonas beringensis]KCZ54686.1 hypothetical protein HY29_13475 [Hyphomonas beringensis]
MQFGRKDVIGAACAVVSIGLVAWLAHESLASADCRDLLRWHDFASVEGDVADPELEALKSRLETGQGSEAEKACVGRVGLPF